MAIGIGTVRRRLFVIAAMTVVAASLTAAGLTFAGRGAADAFSHADQTAMIKQRIAALNLKPRTVELISEKARSVRAAIMRADYSTAGRVAAAVLAESRLQSWRYYPFDPFIRGVIAVNDPAFAARLDDWVARDKNDAMPLLMRARYEYDSGWFRRGSGFVREIRPADVAAFVEYMNKARADADAAIAQNAGNPYGYYLKLKIIGGGGLSKEMADAFADAITKFPAYYQLYTAYLNALDPRWGGSVAAMYAFVDRYAGHAPEYSPLKLLYLSLYRRLLSLASISCNAYRSDRDRLAECVATAMRKIASPDLENKVTAALRLYDHSDRYQFGLAVEGLLFDMLKTDGGDVYSGAILQLAATSMHSDTQLKEDKPDSNNYVIDKAVAESWYVKGFYDNALAKNQEALRDAEGTIFPSEAEKDVAVAGIYEYIGGTYNKLNQYADMIAYEQAAIAFGDQTGEQYFICYGYYKLKAYDDAIRACTATITDQPGNLPARYWRGSAHRDAGQTDAALRDLAAVADSESNFRTSAAIDMSMIYFNRNDDKSALAVLNRNTYLYDPNTQRRSDLAVSYNNRCYAYMQLGELKKALDDCTASLRYGSIPDAYRKQQELVKRLAANSGHL